MYYLIKRHSMILSKFDQLQKDNRDKIVDYFININDKIKLEELRFY